MIHVHRLDPHATGSLIDYVRLLHVPVHCRLRNHYVMLGQRSGYRLGHLLCRMKSPHMLLMSLEAVSGSLARLHRRIICRLVAVIVRTEIQLHQLGKLAECRRHMAMETEAAEIYHGNSSVRVERDTRLVTPEVRILVEVPVDSDRIVFTIIIPLITVQSLPYLIKGIIVLYVLVCMIEPYGNIHLSGTVVLYDKTCHIPVARLKETAS